MDLKSLIAKMTAIEESTSPTAECGDIAGTGDQMLTGANVDECGDMPMPGGMMSHAPKQSDSVTMNLSMNGSGAGGIRDLMSILQNIEASVSDKGHGSDEVDLAFGEATTEPDPQVAPFDAAFPTGDDISSHADNEVPKVNGGGNPYTSVSESLVSRLSEMYNEIKNQ